MNRPETIDIDMIASRLDGLRRGDGDSDEPVQTKPTHYDATRLGIAMDGQSEPIRDEPQPAPEDHAQGPAVAPPPPERPQAEPAALDQPDVPLYAPPRWPALLRSLSDRIGWSSWDRRTRLLVSGAAAVAVVTITTMIWMLAGNDGPRTARAVAPAGVGRMAAPARGPGRPGRLQRPGDTHPAAAAARAASLRRLASLPSPTSITKTLRTCATSVWPSWQAGPPRPDPSRRDGPKAAAPGQAPAPQTKPPVQWTRCPDGFTLRCILGDGDGRQAYINDQLVGVGDTINGAKVIRVEERCVEMEANGKHFILRF